MAHTENKPLDRLTTESAAAPAQPPTLPEPHEGRAMAPASSLASKIPTPALYVHEEETPAGPVVPPQTEDEIAGEPILPPPQPGLTALWQQASPEERRLFVDMYHEELRTLLAAWDAEGHHRPRPQTVSPQKKPKSTSIPS